MPDRCVRFSVCTLFFGALRLHCVRAAPHRSSASSTNRSRPPRSVRRPADTCRRFPSGDPCTPCLVALASRARQPLACLLHREFSMQTAVVGDGTLKQAISRLRRALLLGEKPTPAGLRVLTAHQRRSCTPGSRGRSIWCNQCSMSSPKTSVDILRIMASRTRHYTGVSCNARSRLDARNADRCPHTPTAGHGRSTC